MTDRLRHALARMTRAARARTPAAHGRRPNPFPNVLDRLEDRVVPAGLAGLLSPLAAGAVPVAEVAAGSRLAGVDTSQVAVLNGLFGSLTGGTGFNLTVLDYNGLAGGVVNLGRVCEALRADLGLGSPDQALAADATLGQVLAAAATAATADGNTAAATAFNSARASVGPLAGNVRLADLLHVTLPAGSLAEAEVNALDLLTGTVQLFNTRNVATTPTPVTLGGAALGLDAVLHSVTLQAQVVEPPVIVVGPAGAAFHTAAVRVKLNVDLVDLSLDTAGILAPIRDILSGADATAAVGQLQVYADVAAGSGTIDAISAVTNAVTLRATPSVADLYVGTIADAVFFNRGHAIDAAADLTPGTVGALGVTVLGFPVVTAAITLRAVANGDTGGPLVLTFTAPFPDTQTVGSGAVAVGNLVTDLVGNLELGLTGLGVLDSLASTLSTTLGGVAATVLQPALTSLLGGLVDPALRAAGVSIGELDLAVLGADSPDPAVAADDTVITLAGNAVTAFVQANDTLPAWGSYLLALGTPPAHGTAAINADGSVTYTPAAGFSGTDTFTYTLTDTFGRTTTGEVTVVVTPAAPPDAPPVVNPDTASTTAGDAVTVDVLANDTDPDGTPLSVTGVSQPAHGAVVVNADGTITYTPDAGFVGTDTFVYSAGDGHGGAGSATVTVVVGAGESVNAGPVAVPDVVTVAQGGTVTVAVLGNDTDADGDALTVVALGNPSNGTVTLNADGTITYTPTAGFFGEDRFTYTASDGHGGTAGTSVSVTVVRSNAAPVAVADTPTVVAGQTLTFDPAANDTDADGDALAVTGVTQPAGGVVVLNGDGTVTYTPSSGYVGTDAFTYTVSDGQGGTATGAVTVTVVSGNANPVAVDDTPTAVAGILTSINVTANDTDSDGDTLTVTGVTLPGHGTAVVNPDGTVGYSATAGYVGTDAFTYTVSDGQGGTATGAVTVTVVRGNAAPVPGADTPTVVAGGSLTLNPAANDADADGDTLAVTGVTDPPHGSAVLNGDGTVTYSPDAGFIGTDTFTYTVSDGQGGTATGTVTVTVTPAGPAPEPTPTPSPTPSPTPTPSPVPPARQPAYVVGADATGGPRLTVFAMDGSVRFNLFAFEESFRGGVSVALADIDGDGVNDLIATPRAGGGPRVRVLSGADLHPIADFFVFEESFRGGLFVTTADLNRDGVTDLIVGAGDGGGPRVVAIDGSRLGDISRSGLVGSGAVLANFFTSGDGTRGGVRVAATDRDGDGAPEIITGAGVGDQPIVRVWSSAGVKRTEFLAEGGGTAGLSVSAWSGYLAVGATDARVTVYQGENPTPVSRFRAFEEAFGGAAEVRLFKTPGAAEPLVLIGAGFGGGPRVRALHLDGTTALPDHFAFESSFRGGVNLG